MRHCPGLFLDGQDFSIDSAAFLNHVNLHTIFPRLLLKFVRDVTCQLEPLSIDFSWATFVKPDEKMAIDFGKKNHQIKMH